MPFLLALRSNAAADTVRGFIGTFFNLGALLRFALRLTSAVEVLLTAWTTATSSRVDDLLVPFLSSALRIVLVVIAITTAISLLDVSARYADPLSKISSIVRIVAVASIFVRFVKVGEQMILVRYHIAAEDNLRARKVYTQLHDRRLIVPLSYFIERSFQN